MVCSYFIYDAWRVEFEVQVHLPQKRPNWELDFDLEVLQILCINLNSFYDDYGRCLDVWNKLNSSEHGHGTRSAVASSMNRIWRWRCFRSYV